MFGLTTKNDMSSASKHGTSSWSTCIVSIVTPKHGVLAWRGGGFLLRGKSKKMICFPINATLKHAHMLLPGFTFEKKSPFCTQRCLTIEPPVGKVGNSTSSGHPIHQKKTKSQSGSVPNPVCPSCLPSHRMPSSDTSTHSNGRFCIPGEALHEKSQGLWCN